MHFRSILNCFSLILSVTLLTGCGEYLKGKKSVPEVIELSDDRLTCLQTLPDKLDKTFKGTAEVPEIQASFDCLSSSLNYFKKRTYGAQQGSYTSEEMRKFFEKYFFKKNPISSEFAAHLMSLKAALFGGSASAITKEEIDVLIDFLKLMRDELIHLNPHVKTLLLEADSKDLQWSQITDASEQLRTSLKKLLYRTKLASSDYGFDDFKTLIHDFSDFLYGGQKQFFLQKDETLMPLIEVVKNLLVGPRAHFVDLDDWSQSLNTLIDLYELFLRNHYAPLEFKIESKASLRSINQFIFKGIKLIERSHQIRVHGHIPLSAIDDFMEKIFERYQWTMDVKKVELTYRLVLLRFLDPNKSADFRSLRGLELKHLQTLMREFNTWRLLQAFFDSLPLDENQGGLNSTQIQNAFKRYAAIDLIKNTLSEDPLEQKFLYQTWLDLGDYLTTAVPIVFDAEGKMLLSVDVLKVKQSWKSLTQSNVMWTLTRALMMGYGENSRDALRTAKLSRQSLVDWYDHFKDIGLEMKAFDPRSENSGSRSFFEANYFTRKANGDEALDYRETLEFISGLFSVGIKTPDRIHADAVAAKCALNETDVYGLPLLSEKCFESLLRNNFSVYFGNVPGMIQYVHSLSDLQWADFFSKLMISSMEVGQRRGTVDLGSLRTMVMIVHYVENIFLVADTDLSQGVSIQEMDLIYPRFASFLQQIGEVKSEPVLRRGFQYLVLYGAVPKAWDLVKFEIKKIKGTNEAKRLEVLRVFAVLKDKLNNP